VRFSTAHTASLMWTRERRRVRAALLAAVLSAPLTTPSACTLGITDGPHAPLVGGVYHYSAYLLGSDQLVFRGTLLLEDTQRTAIGGTYLLPAQCVAESGATVDCRGAVVGAISGGADLTFDFDSDRFHHTGRRERNGDIRGLWVLSIERDSTGGAPRRLSGRFVAVPTR
jgi:hypothetical protein